ncbi:hypothetical protein BT69DRAFT_1260079 [Atractiella rhizophila]|nr:hypothetical protein BT69DRAFT_1260079 [Atractiella rhizophila]
MSQLHHRTNSASYRISMPASRPPPPPAGGSASGASRVAPKTQRRFLVLALFFIAVVFYFRPSLPSFSAPERGTIDMDRTYAVERPILSKLTMLDIALGGHSESESQGESGEDGEEEDRPPLVDHIPEPIKPSKVSTTASPAATAKIAQIQAEELDPNTCGYYPCSFLLPAWLGEQETKAQYHLYQLGLLALSLNRTLVLPNVVRSRMGTCYSKPFAFYYSISSLQDMGVPSISYDAFRDWSLRRSPAPSAQVITIAGTKALYPDGAIEVDSASDTTLVPGKPTRNLCLSNGKTGLDFEGWSPLSIFPPEGYHKTEASRYTFGESVVATLGSQEVNYQSSRDADGERPDVLAFNYELRFGMLDYSKVSQAFFKSYDDSLSPVRKFEYFPYSDTWVQLADLIIKHIHPFIAVHWRTETLAPDSLVPCASALINKISDLVTNSYPTIKTVYLATDYPIESLEDGAISFAHSGTFDKVVTPSHHLAMKALLGGFKGSLPSLTLTTFVRQSTTLVFPDELMRAISPDGSGLNLADLDPGLLGIIDKTIASKASVFLTGKPGVFSPGKSFDETSCAKESSFTRQIIGNRKIAMQQEDGVEDDADGGVWNEVEYWARETKVEEEEGEEEDLDMEEK